MLSFSPIVNWIVWMPDPCVAFVCLSAGNTTLLFRLTVSTAAIWYSLWNIWTLLSLFKPLTLWFYFHKCSWDLSAIKPIECPSVRQLNCTLHNTSTMFWVLCSTWFKHSQAGQQYLYTCSCSLVLSVRSETDKAVATPAALTGPERIINHPTQKALENKRPLWQNTILKLKAVVKMADDIK